MDDVVIAANDLADAVDCLDEITRIAKGVAFFNEGTSVCAEYVLKNDGGDASRRGAWMFYMTADEVAARLARAVAEAEADVAKLQATLDATKARYKPA